MELRRWLDRAGFLGTTASVLASGLLQGLGVVSFRVELAFVVLAVVLLHAVFSSLVFTAFVGLSGVVFGGKLLLDHVRAEGTVDAGRVVAVVPVYRDAEVLERSVGSLLASTYDDLAIRVVCEPDDERSRRRAESFADHENVEVLVNTSAPGTKAAAVDHAVAATDGEYVAVFDADERVHPEFVAHAVATLADHDVVQGRTVPEPTGAIEELVYQESVLLSYASRRLLYLLTGFRMASSRAVVMRRRAFERVGGYDPEMLTEDFDFAYRCYAERLDVRETLAFPSRIEAAHSLRDWWGQRKRWMTGYVQVFHRLLGEVGHRDYRTVLAPLVCGSTVVGSALLLSLLSKFVILVLLGAELWLALPVVTVLAVTLAIRLYDAVTLGIDWPTPYWLLTPALFPLYGFTTVKAVFEYLLSWDGGWYAVEKRQ